MHLIQILTPWDNDHLGAIHIFRSVSATILDIPCKDKNKHLKITVEPDAHLITTQDVLNRLQWGINTLSITGLEDGLLDCANISGDAVELSDIY